MAKKKNSKRGYCVEGPSQRLLLYTSRAFARDARDEVCRNLGNIYTGDTWKILYKKGYRVVRIEVREV